MLNGDNFTVVIPTDYKEHTDKRPFCWNTSCGCHKDEANIQVVVEQIQDGLLTGDEANRTVKGEML